MVLSKGFCWGKVFGKESVGGRGAWVMSGLGKVEIPF